MQKEKNSWGTVLSHLREKVFGDINDKWRSLEWLALIYQKRRALDHDSSEIFLFLLWLNTCSFTKYFECTLKTKSLLVAGHIAGRGVS